MRSLYVHCLFIFSAACLPLSVLKNKKEKDIQLTCRGPKKTMPGSLDYHCAVDIDSLTKHDRWLIIREYMDLRIEENQIISGFSAAAPSPPAATCTASVGDGSIHAFLIPANQRLHIREWDLTTSENRTDVLLWLGADPPLSTGSSLGALCKRVRSEIAERGYDAVPTRWIPPKRTSIHFAPSGFHSLDIRPLAPW